MTQSCVDCHVEPAIDIGSGKRCAECWALAYVDLVGPREASCLLRDIEDRSEPALEPWRAMWQPVAPHLRRFIALNPRV